MRLGFFTMPIHPIDRNVAETLKEDREAFLLADRLGFDEALVGEHVADAAENITSSFLFIASLAHATKQIKLGSGVVNLSHHHPALVAAHGAMLDHMLEGRFLMGIGAGVLRSDAEILGVLDEDRTAMLAESIDHILDLWSGEPPYNLSGKYWNLSTEQNLWPEVGLGAIMKPYQKPHPPILGSVGHPFSNGIIELGKRGWSPISGDFVHANWIRNHWERYAQGCEAAGRVADPANWRVARTIFVCEDEKLAQSYAKTDPQSPYRFNMSQIRAKLERAGQIMVLKAHPDLADEDVTLDYVVDQTVICGGVNQVVDQLLAFRETTGDFGTLYYVGKDWADPDLGRRSMELMAEKVMPRINDAIDRQNAAE